MAGDIPVGPYMTFPASTGLSQYMFVDIDTTGKLIKPPTSGRAIGVLVSSGTTGSNRARQQQSVQVYGMAKVQVQSTGITWGTTITATTLGKASTRGTKIALGISVGDAASTSKVQLIPVLLQYAGSTATF